MQYDNVTDIEVGIEGISKSSAVCSVGRSRAVPVTDAQHTAYACIHRFALPEGQEAPDAYSAVELPH